MRYLFKIVAIVGALLSMALAVCSGEDRTVPWFDPALECSELSPEIASPLTAVWGEGGPCAGDSRSNRFKALDNGTVVNCLPDARLGAIWQNDHLALVTGDGAVEQCANLCKDPNALDDASRCSAFCTDATGACDPDLIGRAWRLPDVAELESLKLTINDNECTVQGCRLDTHFEGDCDTYWAADLAQSDDPTRSKRACTDMRDGASGFLVIGETHLVRCVADRN
jgi:hypothetical protein